MREAAITNLVNVALERAQLQHQPMYVYCTHTDWIISNRPPIDANQHIRVDFAPAQAVKLDYDFMTGRWSERVISTPATAPEGGR